MEIHTKSRSSVTLDALRECAALAVFVGHLRSVFFVDYPEVEVNSFAVSAIYALTGFGHQAVMLFFVMSGFLVGSVVIRDGSNGRWSWKGYLIDRLVRMQIVVVPALLLTAACDQLGTAIGDPRVYDGGHPSNTLTEHLSETGTPVVFAANLLPSGDLLLGTLFAVMLYFILHDGSVPDHGPGGRTARELAGCSFTLYAVHFPVVALVAAVTLGVTRVQPTAKNSGMAAFLIVVVIILAWFLARLTEGHTAELRKMLRLLCGLGPRTEPKVSTTEEKPITARIPLTTGPE